MKLLNFQAVSGGAPLFGVIIGDYAVSFETLRQKAEESAR